MMKIESNEYSSASLLAGGFRVCLNELQGGGRVLILVLSYYLSFNSNI